MASAAPTDKHDRTRKIAARMDANDEGALPAFRALTAVLHQNGASWEALVDTWLATTQAESITYEQTASAPADINDWLNDVNQAIATSAHAEPIVQHMRGQSIPDAVHGIIETIVEKTTRKGSPMLVISIANATNLYEGVAVFDQVLIDRILQGLALSGTAKLQKATRPHLGPTLEAFVDTRD